MATWQDVKRYALALPGTSEQTSSRGTREWRVNKKLFVWERPLKASDLRALEPHVPQGPIVAFNTADLEMKDVLLAGDSKVFFTTPHFDGYAAVLARLTAISTKQLKETIREAWLARAPKRLVDDFLRSKDALL